MTAETLGSTLAILLSVAWLLPLAGFAIEIFGGYFWDRKSKVAAYLALGCIVAGFVSSTAAFVTWGTQTGWVFTEDHGHHGDEHHGDHHEGEEHAALMVRHAATGGGEAEGDAAAAGEEQTASGHIKQTVFSGTFYELARFSTENVTLELSLDWYIDSLTLLMFMMVTFIASCIHLFAIGYMSDELTEHYEDHFVHTSHGHFHRPGRFYKFFAYLSLFCFSMLGLVLAGNIFQVFIFWELVGICSYLLIGFYIERKSASTAANKAFIMNRVGDFGFLIGLMILWTSFGTFKFDNHELEEGHTRPGLFTMLRGHDGQLAVDNAENPGVVYLHDAEGQIPADRSTAPSIPYWLLIVAGLGVFAGCVGKSAQFPLQTWLPDAMEGPTPVSALVHSATMVAAGVYLAGRFFPVFVGEVLLTIAYIGCITLFVAATIAIVATDIKRVLAYSTISQLGYMMLAIGVGGWGAGLFHLITHAFFKSLMFLASGSVIHGCHHEQEMPKMGGLWRKMPWTAGAMLVGVIAISGLAIPVSLWGFVPAFSGYHSKDAIVATALAFYNDNPQHILLFIVPLVTAGITAFYMFRLWFYTFWGKPRDQHVYDHAHESPWVMVTPLILLSIFAAFCAVGGENGYLYKMIGFSEPVGLIDGMHTAGRVLVDFPSHHAIHEVHAEAGKLALIAAGVGTLLAFVLYGLRVVNPAEIGRRFSGLHTFLVEKWRFDELYDAMFVKPVHSVGYWVVAADRVILDGILHGMAKLALLVSRIDRVFDEKIVDGLVNWMGNVTWNAGTSFKRLQTGRLRQYVMFIAIGVIGLFAVLFAFLPKT